MFEIGGEKMQQLKKIDLDEIWQKEQGWNAKIVSSNEAVNSTDSG